MDHKIERGIFLEWKDPISFFLPPFAVEIGISDDFLLVETSIEMKQDLAIVSKEVNLKAIPGWYSIDLNGFNYLHIPYTRTVSPGFNWPSWKRVSNGS